MSNATYIGTHQSQGPLRAGSITEPPPQQPQQQQHQNQQPPQPLKPHSQQQGLSLPPSHHLNNQAVSPEAIGSPSSTLGPASDRLSQMTELERFGLPGLLAMISDHSPDHSTLATGQDLTVVGLDLNRPEYVLEGLISRESEKLADDQQQLPSIPYVCNTFQRAKLPAGGTRIYFTCRIHRHERAAATYKDE